VFDLSSDLPLLIEIVDSEERIRSFLPTLDEMVGEGLMTLESVEIIAYRTGPATKS
jgi:PII-like signaling protein